MGQMLKDKRYYQTVIQDENGTVTQYHSVTRISDEPEYIKVYLDCVLTLKGLQKGLNVVLLELLRGMTYAQSDMYGGQVVMVNKFVKEGISHKLGISIKRIEQAITQFVRADLLRRIATGVYQVNPNIIGKGDWTQIKKLRVEFDCVNRDVTRTDVQYIDVNSVQDTNEDNVSVN